jgi:CBS domain containing-hemolysin-like protein
MSRPRRILVTILLGNLVVNILASSLVTRFTIRAFGSAGLGVAVATLGMTLLVLVFGEITPKSIALRHAEGIARWVARPLLLLAKLLVPVTTPLLRLTEAVLGREGVESREVHYDEAVTMLRLAHDEGEVETHERDLVRGVLELGVSPVEDVMTPRIEIFSLPGDLRVAEAREKVRESSFSKIPVEGDTPDHPVGIVTALDLLLADDDATLGSLVREVPWVPEVNPALAQLEEFQRSGDRIAFVVDEHGHLVGLVTLTDLLEEISGEIIEVGDLPKVVYRRVSPDRVVVPARMEIRFFNEEFGTELVARDSETLGGLVLERTGRIPEVGDVFVWDDLEVNVVRAEANRLVTLEVHLPPPPEPTARPGRSPRDGGTGESAA